MDAPGHIRGIAGSIDLGGTVLCTGPRSGGCQALVCASVPNRIGAKHQYRQQPPVRPVPSVKDYVMTMQLSLAPIIALLAGILILAQPKLLNYIVAVYLIVIGLLGLFGGSGLNFR